MSGFWSSLRDTMTFEELSNSLPNGLHDAELERLEIDYAQRLLTISAEIWVGSMNDPPTTREAYRKAKITLSGLCFCVIESPDPAYPYQQVAPTVDDFAPLKLDAEQVARSSVTIPKTLLASLPPGAFVHSLFVSDWNSFVHFAASDAQLEWVAAATYRA